MCSNGYLSCGFVCLFPPPQHSRGHHKGVKCFEWVQAFKLIVSGGLVRIPIPVLTSFVLNCTRDSDPDYVQTFYLFFRFLLAGA